MTFITEQWVKLVDIEEFGKQCKEVPPALQYRIKVIKVIMSSILLSSCFPHLSHPDQNFTSKALRSCCCSKVFAMMICIDFLDTQFGSDGKY